MIRDSFHYAESRLAGEDSRVLTMQMKKTHATLSVILVAASVACASEHISTKALPPLAEFAAAPANYAIQPEMQLLRFGATARIFRISAGGGDARGRLETAFVSGGMVSGWPSVGTRH
jgi:hypothetical protein